MARKTRTTNAAPAASEESAVAVVEAPAPVEIDALFTALPGELQTRIALEPPLREGHGNPRMGTLLKAFRKANTISQMKLAKGELTPNRITTHCQIATLEQGGCRKGADESTITLVAKAVGVSEDVIRALNEADLAERSPADDTAAPAEVTEDETVTETVDA